MMVTDSEVRLRSAKVTSLRTDALEFESLNIFGMHRFCTWDIGQPLLAAQVG